MLHKVAYWAGQNAALSFLKLGAAFMLPPPSEAANMALTGLKKTLTAPLAAVPEKALSMSPTAQMVAAAGLGGNTAESATSKAFRRQLLGEVHPTELKQMYGAMTPPKMPQLSPEEMGVADTMHAPRETPQINQAQTAQTVRPPRMPPRVQE